MDQAQAKVIALQEVRRGLEWVGLERLYTENYFLPEVIEGSYCWIFLRDPAIKIPPESWALDYAVAISHEGEFRGIADFYYDREKLKEYAEKLSEHFRTTKRWDLD